MSKLDTKISPIVRLEQEYKPREAGSYKRPSSYLKLKLYLLNIAYKLRFWLILNLSIIALLSIWTIYKVEYLGQTLTWNYPEIHTDESLFYSILENRFTLQYDKNSKTCHAVQKPDSN